MWYVKYQMDFQDTNYTFSYHLMCIFRGWYQSTKEKIKKGGNQVCRTDFEDNCLRTPKFFDFNKDARLSQEHFCEFLFKSTIFVA